MSAFYIFLVEGTSLIKGLLLIALVRGVYGFVLAGKAVSYCDLVFKSLRQVAASALLHALFSVFLTGLTVRLIAAVLW